jgi:hypothetical protein
MVAVTTRAGKGSPLTNAEIDANWNALVADLNTKVTQAQARAAISVSGSLTYNSTTGVLGFTETPLTSQNIVSALGFTPLSNAGGSVGGTLTVTGNVFAAANAGGARYFGASGGSNTTVVIQSGAVSGIGANVELTADAYAYFDAIETRIRSLDGATPFLSINSSGTNVLTGALKQNGNQVLHAGNYNTYSPTLTGTGASGSWGISITGDANTVDGYHASSFLRSVNGSTPDSNGNVTLNVDLSTRVAKTGDTMTGLLATKGNAAGSYLNANDSTFSVRGDSSNAAVMSFHRAGAYAINMGLDTDNLFKIGGWSDGQTRFQSRADGHLWTPAYGWLNDYFFRSISNCEGPNSGINENCYGGGPILQWSKMELVDDGGNLRLRRIGSYTNCNCK